jgi:signal transduction histidine kinase
MDNQQFDSKLFAELYNSHPQAIIWMNPVWDDASGQIKDFLFSYANDEALNYMDLTREQFDGLSISTSPSMNDELREKVFSENLKVYTTGEKLDSMLYNPVLEKYVRVLRAKLRGGVLTIIQNVTREKEMITQLEKQTSLLNSILENSSNGISVSRVYRDENGKVIDALTTLANDAAVNFIGLPRDIYLSKRATEIEPEVMTSAYYQMCVKTLETGEPFITQYYMHSTKRWLELTVSRLDYNHLIHIFTDVTLIKEAQLELEQTVHALRRSNAYLQDFAHVASHDMKEPLRKILTFIERLQSSIGSKMNDKEAQYFDRIQYSSQRMLRLVDDILEFSRVSEDAKRDEQADLNEQLHIVLADLELAIEEKHAKVTIQDKLPVIGGNKRQLQQLFQNVISNSLKYSRADVPPEINITCKRVTGKDAGTTVLPEHEEKEYHLITLRDNGIGFQQQYAQKIFDMLQRLHQKSEYSGTGIGLSIARKVVENHNGYIWAEGEPGKGATFSILFPA